MAPTCRPVSQPSREELDSTMKALVSPIEALVSPTQSI